MAASSLTSSQLCPSFSSEKKRKRPSPWNRRVLEGHEPRCSPIYQFSKNDHVCLRQKTRGWRTECVDKRRKEKKVHREALLSISLERLLPQLQKMATRPKATTAIPFIAICLADNRAISWIFFLTRARPFPEWTNLTEEGAKGGATVRVHLPLCEFLELSF